MSEPDLRPAELDHHLDRERNLVLAWLRDDPVEPFDLGAELKGEWLRQTALITENFLRRIREAGFVSKLVPVDAGGRPAYEVQWTWKGSSFVGFKQPGPEEKPENAILAGCAALLENQWCRERLGR